MIKKICVAAAVIIICILCRPCSNKDMWDTNYTFNEAICYGDFDSDLS